MATGATVRPLAGGRLHLQHGPIDVVLKAWGRPAEVRRAYEAAASRFQTVLPELVGELGELRRPIAERPEVSGPVARRMVAAVEPFADVFVTPMAAVAGSVADELLAAMRAAGDLDKAFVNDGGDIAVHLTPGETLAVGVAGDFDAGAIPGLNGTVRLAHEHGVGGIATSGFQGRSFSLGIADSVTVLARSAAAADATATLIANAVTVDSPAIERRPARDLDPDTDLGDRLVTTGVGPLTADEIAAALEGGYRQAAISLGRGLIAGAVLMLRGQAAVAGPASLLGRPR
jgi:ApbE superfamily uncharacterized protein (UPF0280 family)